MNQLALPLDWPAAEGEGSFVVGAANADAVRHLGHWSLWPVMATILTGPRKSGRSTLARRFVARSGGALIDDADRVAEETLFHAWNRAQSERRPLLMIADAAPPELEHSACRIWASRLAATPKIAIAEPDADLAAALDREACWAHAGWPPRPRCCIISIPRLERSYVAIQRIIDLIDDTALARRSRLTVPLARRALERMGVIDDSQ